MQKTAKGKQGVSRVWLESPVQSPFRLKEGDEGCDELLLPLLNGGGGCDGPVDLLMASMGQRPLTLDHLE